MDAKSRFSDRVENYIKYRPGYPDDKLLNVLQLEMGFTPDEIVADIGCGTGISAKLFLEYGRVGSTAFPVGNLSLQENL